MVQWVAAIDSEHTRENQWGWCSAEMKMEQMREQRWEEGLERK